MATSADHPVHIGPAERRWRAQFAGHVIADSHEALILDEVGHAPVVYFPRENVETGYFSRTDKVTHCPYKGEASHYTFLIDGQFAENAAWSYEHPKAGMEAITDRIAFYPDKVEVYAVDDAAVNPRRAEEPRDDHAAGTGGV